MSKKYIECPVCGAQYFPGEIFLPNYFLGQPKHIEKDEEGKIIYADGIKQDLKGKYICDRCNTPLNINAQIYYNVTVNEQMNFNTDYETLL